MTAGRSSHASIDARELKRWLHDGGEIALLDVREEGVFTQRHLLLASSLPLSQLELKVDALVPRRSTRIVLVDDDTTLAARAQAKLRQFGYLDIHTLDGGIDAWIAAGFMIYSGVNVPSKAFGEFVEHESGTPRMDAAEVKKLRDAGAKVVILDSRPLVEFQRMSIPGGIDCPGAELVFRAHDLVRSDTTLVVVNCAGRTRSIIGAQSLINAGLPHRVVALKDGTMGWHLAGFDLTHGASAVAPPPTRSGLAKAKQAAARVAERFGVRYIDVATVRRFAEEMDQRSLYLLDVRSPEEFAAGHLACTLNAPGGQLVQATDAYIGTRNSRVLLIDDHGVRATMTASWLIQMGWQDVYVVRDALSSGPLLTGPVPVKVLGLAGAPTRTLSVPELNNALAAQGSTVVVDLDTSLRYREGHIPGAWFGVRSRLATDLAKLPRADLLVLTSADGVLARLACAEVSAFATSVKSLAGGTQAWRQAGLPLASGLERLASDLDDVSYKAYDHTSKIEDRMREYLSWEVALAEQIKRDDDVTFRNFYAEPRAVS